MDLFVGKWKITSWSPDTEDIVPRSIPVDGFMLNGPLNIMRELTLAADFYRLEWLTKGSQLCFASGLQFSGQDVKELTSIDKLGIVASFAGRELYCELTLQLDPNNPSNLNGTIRLAGNMGVIAPEVGSGTFTATAHPDG
jgi:hypothetical protein